MDSFCHIYEWLATFEGQGFRQNGSKRIPKLGKMPNRQRQKRRYAPISCRKLLTLISKYDEKTIIDIQKVNY